MAVVIDELEVTPAPAPESSGGGGSNAEPGTPPAKSESMETALQRLEERCARLWAH
jgi:hypothetical protein